MASTTNYDVIILGGGPAGISAAVWCADLGLKAVLIEERTELGGQLLRIFAPITNYPGLSTENGIDMRDRLVESLRPTDCTIRTNTSCRRCDVHSKTLVLEDGDSIQGKAIMIATGVRRRHLKVAGELEFAGRGILDSGAKDKDLVRDAHVVIVGGGDAALENALVLSKNARTATVVHRGKDFSARNEFVEAAKGRPNIIFKTMHTVRRFLGNEKLEGVELIDEIGNPSTIDVQFALIRIGVEPNTELFRGQLDLDEKNYIAVACNFVTSIPNVYAIGDVACPNVPTIATAIGSAAIAVKELKLTV